MARTVPKTVIAYVNIITVTPMLLSVMFSFNAVSCFHHYIQTKLVTNFYSNYTVLKYYDRNLIFPI